MDDDTIYFYTPHQEFGEFSNFAKFGVELEGFWWPTVEHFFQAQKFLNVELQQKIRNASNAKQAADLGRSRKFPLRNDWEEVKIEIMSKAVLKKFQTHSKLASLLISTGNRKLVESAPGDFFWGCGIDGSGLNHLGKILEEVREMISKYDGIEGGN